MSMITAVIEKKKEEKSTNMALHAPGTWYLRCNLDNQYLAWVFKLSASRANSKFSFADCYQEINIEICLLELNSCQTFTITGGIPQPYHEYLNYVYV